MERKKYLIVVAGGRGERMGADVPKQFLPLGGRAILARTVERFAEACPGVNVVTVMNPDYIDRWKQYCLAEEMIVPQRIVAGGITRFHSVQNALGGIPDGAAVAVHDGVRPFVSGELIRRLFALSEYYPALAPALPCTDTMRFLSPSGDDSSSESRLSGAEFDGSSESGAASHGELLLDTLKPADRKSLYRIQTPQVFHSEVLKKAYSQPYSLDFTDDASVVEASGMKVRYTKGEKFNLKITEKDDLILSEAVLKLL